MIRTVQDRISDSSLCDFGFIDALLRMLPIMTNFTVQQSNCCATKILSYQTRIMKNSAKATAGSHRTT